MRRFENDHKGEKGFPALLSQSFRQKGGELVRCNKLIRGGFSFCGIDIADLGLNYAPEKEDTYVYRPTDVTVHEETFDGHDGGYLYGISKQSKEFILRCYFEDSAIDHGIMERIYNLFRTGKSGKLVFSRRPWCYYYATVTSLPHPELSNYLNGLITITMKASYPFARSDFMYSEPDDIQHDLVMKSTAMLDNASMVPDTSFSSLTSPISGDNLILLHNPGTERAPVSIMVSGDAGLGVVIRNKTTGQECKIVAMDKAHTSNIQKAVYLDGINGNTSVISMTGEGASSSGFVYHDSGFIQLEPAYPCIREIFVRASSTDRITLVNTLYEDVVGQYIFIDDNWYRIEEQIDSQTLRLNDAIFTEGTNATVITKMNEIEVVPIDTMDLTHLSFLYKPTFA